MPPDDARGADPLHQIRQRSAELRERAEQMQRELAELGETIRSSDGLVRVTVGAGGIMRALDIDSSAARAGTERLGASIMSAYQQGCRVVGERAAEIMERHAPGSPAVAMMREAVPPDPDDAQGTAR